MKDKKSLSDELYSLIDRLQICSEINYPDRKWSNDFYYSCAWEWRDKIEDLKIRVEEVEKRTLKTEEL